MNSKQLWDNLEKMTTTEIKVNTIATIIYLVKDRQVNLKEFIKDIKNIFKKVNV
ncbi:MAG: hypothetical protein IKU37_01515 [Candidatus Gastranaerophilales bacterium]|nr:hypothetical protein [Candidatus Gastranaerophilales bacterium]